MQTSQRAVKEIAMADEEQMREVSSYSLVFIQVAKILDKRRRVIVLFLSLFGRFLG